MQVQPYFPESHVVAGNVANEPYDIRLGFVRRAVFYHWMTSVLVVVSATLNWGPALGSYVGWWTFGGLIILSAARNLNHGGFLDRATSHVLFPLWLVMLGQWLRTGLPFIGGEPATILFVCSSTIGLYVLLCGRDLSFTGMFVMSLLGSLIVLLTAYEFVHELAIGWRGLVAAGVYLFFLVYDLASLLQRRRLSEPWLAAVDLYRDILNVFTYGFRVLHHWRTFKI